MVQQMTVLITLILQMELLAQSQRAKADRGVLICGTGIGIAMTADKVLAFAPLLFRLLSSQSLLASTITQTLLVYPPADSLDLAVNEAIVDTFLSTEFAGGRHTGRCREDHA